MNDDDVALNKQIQRNRHKRVRRIIASATAALVVVGCLAFAYRPAYNYYRRAIADCIEWSNSYALSTQRFSALNDEVMRTIPDDIPSDMGTIQTEAEDDREQYPAVFGAPTCGAKQWPGSLHDRAERFHTLTSRSESRIVRLHQLTDSKMNLQLAHDPKALTAARARLAAIVEGVSALHGKGTEQSLAESRRLLENPAHAHTESDAPVSSSPALADYQRAQDRLLSAADKAVKAKNRLQGIDCADPKRKCIALTFDDGPSATVTPQILDALEHTGVAKNHRAHATFFAVGGAIGDQTVPFIRRAAQNGYPYGSHTWSHIDLPRIMSSGTQQTELDGSSSTIERITGQPVNLIRPPHGAIDETSRDYIANYMGAAIAVYDVDSYDWSAGATARSVETKVLAQVRPGSIILMHDIQPHTAAVLPDLLRKLERRGFTLATIPELIGEYPRPGAIYYSRDNILRM